MTRIAIIGGGRIGEAVLAGIIEAGKAPADILVVEPTAARAQDLKDRYHVRIATIADAAEVADLLMIAVKPQAVGSVLTDIAAAEGIGERDQVVLSLAAGVSTARLESKLPAGFAVVRAMPNTPMLVGEGMIAIVGGRHAKPADLELVRSVLSPVGVVVTVTEPQMDAVTAVSGSGPAYFFMVVEAMIDAAVSLGLPRDLGHQLVVQTLVGSAAMLDQLPDSPGDLRAAVTSPGGTTAAALRELERAGLRSAFIEALHASRDRSVAQGGHAD